jgi:hypothetical protein
MKLRFLAGAALAVAMAALPGAAQEFSTLSANYSEFRNLIAGMAGRMSQSAGARSFSLGDTTLSQDGAIATVSSANGRTEFTAPRIIISSCS